MGRTTTLRRDLFEVQEQIADVLRQLEQVENDLADLQPWDDCEEDLSKDRASLLARLSMLTEEETEISEMLDG